MKLLNREHIFLGVSTTYQIKIPVDLEGPAGKAGQTGRLTVWQLPPRFTGLRGSVLGQLLDQGPKDSGLGSRAEVVWQIGCTKACTLQTRMRFLPSS